MSVSITDWLTALGTVGAVVVALSLTFFESLRRKYNKPVLTTEFENKEPFCRHSRIVDDPNQPEGYFLRLQVWNTGRSIARDCEVKLFRILDADTQKEMNFDPTNLHWTGHGEKNTIDIHKGTYEYLDVVFVKDNSPQIWVYHNEKAPRGFSFQLPRNNYILHLLLVGRNTNTVKKLYKLEVGAGFAVGYDKITMQETKIQQNINNPNITSDTTYNTTRNTKQATKS